MSDSNDEQVQRVIARLKKANTPNDPFVQYMRGDNYKELEEAWMQLAKTFRGTERTIRKQDVFHLKERSMFIGVDPARYERPESPIHGHKPHVVPGRYADFKKL